MQINVALLNWIDTTSGTFFLSILGGAAVPHHQCLNSVEKLQHVYIKFGVDWNMALNTEQVQVSSVQWTDQLNLEHIGPMDNPRQASIPWCMLGWQKLSKSWGTASQEKKISKTCKSSGTKKAQQEKFLCRTKIRTSSWNQYKDWWKC